LDPEALEIIGSERRAARPSTDGTNDEAIGRDQRLVPKEKLTEWEQTLEWERLLDPCLDQHEVAAALESALDA